MKIIKILQILLLFLISFYCVSSQSILEKEKAATHIDKFYHLDGNLKGVIYVEEFNKLICFGQYGTILTSNDLGKTWEQKFSGTNRQINKIIRINNQLHAVGDNGLFLKSDNYGTNWKFIENLNISENLLDIEYNENGIGIILDSKGNLYLSDDYGLKWTIIYKENSLINTNFTKSFIIDNDIYLFNKDGALLYSNDFGINWETIDLKIKNNSFAKSVINIDNKFYILTNNELITYDFVNKSKEELNILPNAKKIINLNNQPTIISRQNKEYLSLNQMNIFNEWELFGSDSAEYFIGNNNVNDILFLSNGFGIAVGEGKSIYITNNNGHIWSLRSLFYTEILYNFQYLNWYNDKIGYYLTNNSLIFKTIDGGVTWKCQKYEDYQNSKYKSNFHFIDIITGKGFFTKRNDNIINYSDIYVTNDYGDTYTKVWETPGNFINSIERNKGYYIAATYGRTSAPLFDYTKLLILDSSFNKVKEILLDTIIVSSIKSNEQGNLLLYCMTFEYLDKINGKNPIFHPKVITYDYINEKYLNEFEFVGSGLGGFQIFENQYYSTIQDTTKYFNLPTMKFYKSEDNSKSWELFYKDSIFSNFLIIDDNVSIFKNNHNFYYTNDDGRTFFDSVSTNDKLFMIEPNHFSKEVVYLAGKNFKNLSDKMLLFKNIEPDFVSSIENTENIIENFKIIYIENAYPNPTRDNINVSLFYDQRYNMEDAVISVLDYLGKPINVQFEINPKSNYQSEIIINTQNLSTGMYLLNVKLGNTNETINFGVIK